jgi:hypothetical protein
MELLFLMARLGPEDKGLFAEVISFSLWGGKLLATMPLVAAQTVSFITRPPYRGKYA